MDDGPGRVTGGDLPPCLDGGRVSGPLDVDDHAVVRVVTLRQPRLEPGPVAHQRVQRVVLGAGLQMVGEVVVEVAVVGNRPRRPAPRQVRGHEQTVDLLGAPGGQPRGQVLPERVVKAQSQLGRASAGGGIEAEEGPAEFAQQAAGL